MNKTPSLPKGFSVSIHLYQTLLVVYPSDFRLLYGGDMLQVFRDCCRRALLEAGTAGLLSLWWRTILDTLKTAIEEHSQRGVYMSKSKFIKLSGWAFILGAIAFSVSAIAAGRPKYSQYNALSLPIDRFANAVAAPLMVMGFLLICVGYIGLRLRYGQRIGNLGRLGLGLGVLGGIISAVTWPTVVAYGPMVPWVIFSLGGTFHFLGLVLFGIDSLRQCILPRWNGLPILAGIWLPLMIIYGGIYEYTIGYWPNIPTAAITIMLLLTVAGFIGLGYLLQSDSQPAGIAAAAA